MPIEIQKLLDELYVIDPGLKEHEQEVIAAIQKLQESRPDVPLDDAFVRSLREKLLVPAPPISFTSRVNTIFNNLLPMNRKSFIIAGASALSLVIVVGALITLQLPSSGGPVNAIALLDPGAFGLLAQNTGNMGLGSAAAMSSERSVAMGGQGSMPLVANNSVSDAKMIVSPEYRIYTYKYTGDSLTVPESTLPVYRRVKEIQDSNDVTRLLSRKDFGMMDLGSFANMKLQSVDLYQDVDDGYVMNINLREGRVSMYADWNRWYVKDGCTTGPCQWTEPIPANELAGDDEFIRVSNEFLDAHGIDRSRYGEPSVDKQWRQYEIMRAQTEGNTSIFAPASISVVYPLVIEGNVISDTSGAPYGLRVNVQARKMKVEGIWNLTTNRFERSNYTIEQNADRILTIANRGGMYGGWFPEGAQIVELELGAPTMTYILQDHYQSESQTSSELYMPAYRFPILNPPTDMYSVQPYIVIPLVKEMLDEQDKMNPPQGTPMPLIDGPSVRAL